MPFLHVRPILIALLSLVPAFSADWKPVTDAELQMKAPLVDKTADAEAILWEVRVSDENKGGYLETARHNYLRMKIFSERGRERAKVELTCFKKMNIGRIADAPLSRMAGSAAARHTRGDCPIPDQACFTRYYQFRHESVVFPH